MEDEKIVELFFQRSEQALVETKHKYENYCYRIAYNILYNNEDSEECVNDTYMKAWNAIPPTKPVGLCGYLGKITRNLALHVYEKKHRKKRGEGQVEVVFEELKEVLSTKETPEDKVLIDLVTECINQFLRSLPQLQRMVFVGRYWHFESIEEIATHLGITKSKTKSMLYRMRKDLKQYLEKEEILV